MDAHRKSMTRWYKLPRAFLFTVFVFIQHITVLVAFIFVNLELWTKWVIPTETCWFILHIALLLFDKSVSHNIDLASGQVHISVTQRSLLHGLLCVLLVVDGFAFGREVNIVGWTNSDNVSNQDKSQMALVTIVFAITFVRCLEFWLAQETDRPLHKLPTEFDDDEEGGGDLELEEAAAEAEEGPILLRRGRSRFRSTANGTGGGGGKRCLSASGTSRFGHHR